MELSSYIAARWGPPIGCNLDGDKLHKVRFRNSHLWRYIHSFGAAAIPEPQVEGVHSARALPALIHYNGRSIILWDAGLGTLLDYFSFMLPHPQPPAVADAYVNRVCAVRLAAAGRPTSATAHARKATELLHAHPIDRRHEFGADAESQFEVWLTTEMQERFALAHEQIHYLQRSDPDQFNGRCAALLRIVDNVGPLGLADPSPLRAAPKIEPTEQDPANLELVRSLWERNLDPYSWYLKSWVEGDAWTRNTDRWVLEYSALIGDLNADRALLHESVCDVFGALAVCIDAHDRQRGWDATMAAACSRVALESLGMIAQIDATQSIASKAPNTSADAIRIRGKCLEIVLPPLLLHVLRPGVTPDDPTVDMPDHPAAETLPSVGDLREVMRLAGERAFDLYYPALERLTLLADTAEYSFQVSDDFLRESGFHHVRPSADYRESWLFWLGVIDVSPRLMALLKQTPGMASEVQFLVERHQRGDWGDIPYEDTQANRNALWRELEDDVTPDGAWRHRGAIYSFYICQGHRIFVVTDSRREQTTVCLSGEL